MELARLQSVCICFSLSQHCPAKKRKPLECTCKQSRHHAHWTSNVFRRSVCGCNEWAKQYLHNGESSASVYRRKNHLLSRFVSTLKATCHDVHIVILGHLHHSEKSQHHVSGSSRSTNSEGRATPLPNMNTPRGLRNRTRSFFIPQGSSKTSFYKPPSKTERSPDTTEGCSNSPESPRKTSTTSLKNFHQCKTERLSASSRESLSKSPRTHSQSRSSIDQVPGSSKSTTKVVKCERKSFSPEGNIQTKSFTLCERSSRRRSFGVSRSCCGEDVFKKTSSYVKRGPRGKRKRSDSHGNCSISKRGRKPYYQASESKSLSSRTKDKRSLFNANTPNYFVGDGQALAKLRSFQPVVVLNRLRLSKLLSHHRSHLSLPLRPIRSPPSPTFSHHGRSRSASVERVCDKHVRLERGRSRMDQFQTGNSCRDTRNSSAGSGRSRAKSDPLKGVARSSPILTRSRSHSLTDLSHVPRTDSRSLQYHDRRGIVIATTSKVELQESLFLRNQCTRVGVSEQLVDGRESPAVSLDTFCFRSSSDETEDEMVIDENYINDTIATIEGLGTKVNTEYITSPQSENKETVRLHKVSGKVKEKSNNVVLPLENSTKPSSSYHSLCSPSRSFSPTTSGLQPTCSSQPGSSWFLPLPATSTPSPSLFADSSTRSGIHPAVITLSSSSDSSQSSLSLLSSTRLNPSPSTSGVPSVSKSQIFSLPSPIAGTSSQLLCTPMETADRPASPSCPSRRRSIRSNRTMVHSYSCSRSYKGQCASSTHRAVWRSSPPPIFPERSGSPTNEECRIKARALTARKFVPMSRVATVQRTMMRQLQRQDR